MTNPVMITKGLTFGREDMSRGRVLIHRIWCPGCNDVHAPRSVITPEDGVGYQAPVWDWDGNETHPTFSPSLLVYLDGKSGSKNCHSFIRNGVWEFLQDSWHSLAGQNIPMIPVPDWMIKED